MAGDSSIAERLEMLLVLQWLDEGRAPGGDLMLSIPTAASELGLHGDAGRLAIMGALGTLEQAKRVRVEWPGRTRVPSDPRVTLSGAITRDAHDLFGP